VRIADGGRAATLKLPEAISVPASELGFHKRTARVEPSVAELFDKLAELQDDPLGFVMWAFPWGEPGTSLEREKGPEPWQEEQLKRIGEKLRAGGDLGAIIEEDVASGHGIGKLLASTHLVPTPDRGWVQHGSLRPGDAVFGGDGSPTTVTQVHHFENVPMYRVTFDDRSHCDVSSGHLWNVRGRQERRNGHDTWRTLSVVEILNLGVKRTNGAAQARQWEIPQQGAAQYPERELLIDPYLLGMWIGNGNQYTLTQPQCPDLRAWAETSGVEWNPYTDRLADLWRPRIGSQLRDLRLFQCRSWEKFIPPDYLTASVEQRAALLAGLMDTDGTIAPNGVSMYDTVSEQLAQGVIELVRSLGGKATLQPTVKEPFYRDADGEKVFGRDCYRVTVRTPFNPFRRKVKAERWQPCQERYLTRWIESIEPLPNAPHGQCISVAAPDGLYQANDYIVTHNSAEVSWLILWAISTFEDTRGVVTANTEGQLKTKTWAELGKWYQLFIAKQLFSFTATAIYIKDDPDREKTWRVDMVPWTREKSEAFAGMHNKGKRVLILFDEASAIDDLIYEVTEGALTDEKTQILWLRYGNPTKTTGRFFKNCQNAGWVSDVGQPLVKGREHRENVFTRVDSRTVRLTNKKQIQTWIDEYGEDSDFVRVRVRGLFPRAGFANFIAPEAVMKARRRQIQPQVWRPFPKVLAVDPARFGDDFTVITLRQGLWVHWQLALSGFDGVDVAGRVFELARKEGPISAIVYDAIGNGADLDSALRRMPKLNIPLLPVMWGQPAKDDKQYFNQRAECWGKMRDWLETGHIPDDDDLDSQLTSLDFGYDAKFRIQLESKKDAKKRGVRSPDKADSLALSFVPELIDRKVTLAKVKPVQRRTVVWSR
jgi:hypothetical protein